MATSEYAEKSRYQVANWWTTNCHTNGAPMVSVCLSSAPAVARRVPERDRAREPRRHLLDALAEEHVDDHHLLHEAVEDAGASSLICRQANVRGDRATEVVVEPLDRPRGEHREEQEPAEHALVVVRGR